MIIIQGADYLTPWRRQARRHLSPKWGTPCLTLAVATRISASQRWQNCSSFLLRKRHGRCSAPGGQQPVHSRGEQKSHEPRVVINELESLGNLLDQTSGRQKSWDVGQHSENEGCHGVEVEAPRVPVLAVRAHGVEIRDIQVSIPDQEVVGDDNASHGAQQGRVPDEPGVDEALAGLNQPPGRQKDAENGGDHASLPEREHGRVDVDEGVGRGHHIGSDVGRDCGQNHTHQRQQSGHKAAHEAQHLDRVRDGSPEDHHSRRGDRQSHERERCHEEWQPQRLPHQLIGLTVRIACEICTPAKQPP
ncbi:hypothetical protein Mapa_014584 [Marchantia paleacea]|nr:hypothetical protein Mapa_014584 [Marchantia paleacea]